MGFYLYYAALLVYQLHLSLFEAIGESLFAALYSAIISYKMVQSVKDVYYYA